MKSFTCSHSLSQIKGSTRCDANIYTTCISRDNLFLESYAPGMLWVPRYLPRKNATHLRAFVYDGEGNTSYLNGDIIEQDDFEFCKERISSEEKDFLLIPSLTRLGFVWKPAVKTLFSAKKL